jgi:hypothetical protein
MLSSVFLQSFYYIYYLQKWGLHNRSQSPSDSENRRQIGGYIIAPRAHLTAKTEGRSGEREIVVYWYSFSNPRTVCIHYGFSLDTHTEILQGEHVLFGVVKCRCSEKKKWKLDAQLYSLLARYVCDLHALHDLWPRCDAKVRRRGATPRCDANLPAPAHVCLVCLLFIVYVKSPPEPLPLNPVWTYPRPLQLVLPRNFVPGSGRPKVTQPATRVTCAVRLRRAGGGGVTAGRVRLPVRRRAALVGGGIAAAPKVHTGGTRHGKHAPPTRPVRTGTGLPWRQACDNALLPTGMPANNTWACRGAPPAPFSQCSCDIESLFTNCIACAICFCEWQKLLVWSWQVRHQHHQCSRERGNFERN